VVKVAPVTPKHAGRNGDGQRQQEEEIELHCE
jgi:hypothetical protein